MFIGSLIAFIFLVVGIAIGIAIGSAAILLSDKAESKFAGKPTPEVTVEPSPEFIPEIEAPGPELTRIQGEAGGIHLIANPEALDKAEFDEPPKSPDITQMNVTLDPGFPIEDYIEMWFDQNFDVEKRMN